MGKFTYRWTIGGLEKFQVKYKKGKQWQDGERTGLASVGVA
jgi:hypothetical protein